MSVHRGHVWGLWRPKEGISSPEAGVTVLNHHAEAGDLTQILQKSGNAGKGRAVSPALEAIRTETKDRNFEPGACIQSVLSIHLHHERLALEGRESFRRLGERGLLCLEASLLDSAPLLCAYSVSVPTVCPFHVKTAGNKDL